MTFLAWYTIVFMLLAEALVLINDSISGTVRLIVFILYAPIIVFMLGYLFG